MKKSRLMCTILAASMLLAGCGSSSDDETTAAETTGDEVVETDGTDEVDATDGTDGTDEADPSDPTEPAIQPVESVTFPEYSELINMFNEYLAKMELPEDQRPEDVTDFEALCGVAGIQEVLGDENAYDEIKLATADIDGNGTQEFFIIADLEAEDSDRPYILTGYYLTENGELKGLASGWARSRLYYLANGEFLRIGSDSAEITTIEPEVAHFDGFYLSLGITHEYYTNGNVDADGDIILYEAADKWNPDYESTEIVWGKFDDYDTTPDLYQFDNIMSLNEYYAAEAAAAVAEDGQVEGEG
ncbi:MAG: hypothetical protein II167_00165 [Clostridiales bacterium]|nr:hypothetical protein [Clostridiales bacterium]